MLVLAGGSLFLFNRKSVRFFRKDGHDWRKKSDGKTVRETHEKLKVHSFTDLWLMVVSPVCCGTDCCSGRLCGHQLILLGHAQVGNKDVLNCYYAHAEDSLQVRSLSLILQSSCNAETHHNIMFRCIECGFHSSMGVTSL